MPKRVGTFLTILDKTLETKESRKKKITLEKCFRALSAAFAHPGQSP